MWNQISCLARRRPGQSSSDFPELLLLLARGINTTDSVLSPTSVWTFSFHLCCPCFAQVWLHCQAPPEGGALVCAEVGENLIFRCCSRVVHHASCRPPAGDVEVLLSIGKLVRCPESPPPLSMQVLFLLVVWLYPLEFERHLAPGFVVTVVPGGGCFSSLVAFSDFMLGFRKMHRLCCCCRHLPGISEPGGSGRWASHNWALALFSPVLLSSSLPINFMSWSQQTRFWISWPLTSHVTSG